MHCAHWLSTLIAAAAAAWAPIVAADEAPSSRAESGAAGIWTQDGMYFVSGHSGALFLKPAPLDLGRYRAVSIQEIHVITSDRSRALKPSEEKRLKGYFARRLERVFERHGWSVVDAPAGDALEARLVVRNLAMPRARDFHHGNVVTNPSREKIKIALELRDAASNDRRLLYGDERRLPFRVYAGTDLISIRRVEDAFYEFSNDLARILIRAERGEFEPPARSS